MTSQSTLYKTFVQSTRFDQACDPKLLNGTRQRPGYWLLNIGSFKRANVQIERNNFVQLLYLIIYSISTVINKSCNFTVGLPNTTNN